MKEGKKEGREATCSGEIFAARPSFPLLARLCILSQDLSILFWRMQTGARPILDFVLSAKCFCLFTEVNASLPEVGL